MAGETGVNALVTHPAVGSLWLADVRIQGDCVNGDVYDQTVNGYEVRETLTFPRTCVRKWGAGHAPDCAVHQLESCDCEGSDG